MMKLKTGLIFGLCLVVPGLFAVGCAAGSDVHPGLDTIVRPYSFNIVKWELASLFGRQERAVPTSAGEVIGEKDSVTAFFALGDRIKELEAEAEERETEGRDRTSVEKELAEASVKKRALVEAVEKTIERQVRDGFREQGIYNPLYRFIKSEISFPPLNITLDKPPHLLVVSPRDRIESIREITLSQDMAPEAMEEIEAQVDELGVSSLVVGLGGFGGTYPTFVTDRADLKFTLNAVAEEWLHQYLSFKPLGFLYLLDLSGIARNYDIAVMNETLAGIVSDEIGAAVYQKYYAGTGLERSRTDRTGTGFEFNREMRETRRTVDALLARGEIELAEGFMERKRQFLAEKGYHIRKLNQAYFAFYGAYADDPTSISPIGTEMKVLRERSASLPEFLETVAGMTGRQDLSLSLQ